MKSMPNHFSDLLFGDYRRRALERLLLNPDQRYHVREIARLTCTVAGTLHKELNKLADAGILLSEKVGNQRFYQANKKCPIYTELVSILRKTLHDKNKVNLLDQLKTSRVALSALARQHHIKRLVLFGSAARGELEPDSDIDLLVEFEQDKAPSLGGMVKISDDFSVLFGGRKIDIATPSILNNPYRKRAIESEMEVLYAA